MKTKHIKNDQSPELTQAEIDNIIENTKQAIQDGRADHLHPDQSFAGRYLRKLHRIADAALKENVSDNTFDERLQGILSLVYTLCNDGRTYELYDKLATVFPEFFILNDFQRPVGVLISEESFKQLENI